MKINHGGDDLFINRLFSYLQNQLTITIEDIKPIRKKVFYVKSPDMDFILKGFSSFSRLKQQEDFLRVLKGEGFLKTYSFYQLAKYPPLHFEGSFYSCLEYIQPSDFPFTFHQLKDQLEGLSLLNDFHSATKSLAKKFERGLSHFNQLAKWNERSAIFLNNLPIIKYYVQKEIINELLVWADWSLKGIQAEQNFFLSGKKVILHGDVAHHNFLRANNGELHLIDFDLISLGHSHSDYLQYANRILPYLDWSFKDLAGFKIMHPFILEKGFLYGLGYPTDIFREWNRAIRERSHVQQEKIQQLLNITVGQFKERQNFFKELQSKVE
ncbi:phosphotransferase [Bacillus sp. DTU_2020_1000418_1_SI_GHA_SEK_038]|uniref:phosphotransferase n=1 Tax=Bacillus sp. DTU_2020_1000418_1_SI_GHA_SEK_038 TaxID=3077585 RepID=UPI0028E2538B|nr:phosphotransferase [Bacillus sp. DTU_2020_1000418_1_SI_GHA_SEK_038]WNS74436.1 phosphotransferase [Bacillus sp. DTU_2020_1000418_1_SI_GHA_SEK_038]